jgi:hypothetical protein
MTIEGNKLKTRVSIDKRYKRFLENLGKIL